MSTKKRVTINPKDKKNTPSSRGAPKHSPSPTKSKVLSKASEDRAGGDDFLRCDLCRHTIDDPRTLKCLHSYCRDCLMTYIFETSKDDGDNSKITCPVCLQATDAPAEGKTPEEWATLMPTNDFLKGYLEAKSLKDPKKKCDTCKRQNKMTVAKLWCRICHDALCENCVGFHNALKTTKEHTLANIDKVRELSVEEIMSEPLCRKHDGEPMIKFCEKHKDIICEKCDSSEHKSCKVSTLKDALAKHNTEIEKLTSDLDEETKFAKSIYDDRTHADKAFDNEQVEVLRQIQAVRQKISENLKQCEDKLMEEYSKIYNAEKTEIEKDRKEAQRIKKSVGKVKGLAENTVIHGDKSHVLQVLPAATREGHYYKGKLTTLNDRLKNTNIDFRIDPALEKLMNNVNKLGDLKVSKSKVDTLQTASTTSLKSQERVETHQRAESQQRADSQQRAVSQQREDSDPEDEIDVRGYHFIRTNRPPAVRFEEKTKPRKVYEKEPVKKIEDKRKKIPITAAGSFDGRTKTDSQQCWFTGVGFSHDGHIVLVDRNNCKIKVFNKNKNLVSETTLEHEPFGLVIISTGELAVTIPRENKIEVYRYGSSLSKKETITTSEGGYGIAYSTETGFYIACACASPPSIKIVSRSGEEKHHICPEDDYHVPMFFRPWYVKLGKKGGTMYVSDCHKSRLTSISGTVMKLYMYQHGNMHSPRGLHVTNSGHVIMCGFGSDNVQLINPNGQFVGEVLGRKEQVYGPQDVAVNDSNDLMALTSDPSSGNSDIVKLFKVSIK